MLISVFGIPAFAEIQKTQFGDDQLLSLNSDGSELRKFTSTPERIKINNSWVDFRFLENDNYFSMETGHGSVRLNKNTCSFEFNQKGILNNDILFTDSIVPKIANNGSSSWNEIQSVSSATCETYGSSYQLVAKKYSANVGFIEYKYINTGSAWKTQLEATNLSNISNKKFGFTQTIDLNHDTVIFGNSTKNLDNFNGTTLDRNWILSHESKLIQFLNGVNFDFDLGLNNLDSIYILDTGFNKSKISFNYLYDQKIILPGEKIIIDPTYSSTATTEDSMQSGVGTTCSGRTYTGLYGQVRITWDASICRIPFLSYDISTITPGSTVNSATWTYDVTASSIVNNCKLIDFATNVSGSQGDYDSLFTGAGIANSFTNCQTVSDNKVVTFNSTGISKIQENVSANNGYYAFSIWFVNEPVAGTEAVTIRSSDAVLEIIYTGASNPYAITDLTTTSINQTQICYDWSEPYLGGGNQYLLGYQINITTPYTNNPLVYLNNTGSSTSSYCATPLTLNTPYSARISAWTNNTSGHPFNNATGNIVNATTSNFNPPGTPTLSALALSDTSIRFTSIAGIAGDNSTLWYGFRCYLNGAGVSTIISNSTIPNPRIYEYTGLSLGDILLCQWRDGSVDGWSPFSNNATATLELQILQDQRITDPNDRLLNFANWIEDSGGIWFGLGLFPFVTMIFGFMAGKKTVRIFTLAVLALMGIIHASGYFVYPDWYWSLSLLLGVGLILGRQKSD